MNNKALVVIDIQNDITKHYRDIISNINAAIEWATAEGRPRQNVSMSFCIGRLHGSPYLIIQVIVERTPCAVPSTHATGNTTLNSLFADADDLSLDTLAVQGLCHLTQSHERIAVLPWATVNQKYLCHISIPTFVNCECKYSEISPFLRTFADDFNKICD